LQPQQHAHGMVLPGEFQIICLGKPWAQQASANAWIEVMHRVDRAVVGGLKDEAILQSI
jgi:hypothetical protein